MPRRRPSRRTFLPLPGPPVHRPDVPVRWREPVFRQRETQAGGRKARPYDTTRNDEGLRRRRGGPRGRPPLPGVTRRREGQPPRPSHDADDRGPRGSKALPPSDVDQVNSVLIAASLENDRIADPPLELEDRLPARVERLRVRDEQVRRDLFADGRAHVHGPAAREDGIDLEAEELEETLRGARDEARRGARDDAPGRGDDGASRV